MASNAINRKAFYKGFLDSFGAIGEVELRPLREDTDEEFLKPVTRRKNDWRPIANDFGNALKKQKNGK